MLAFTLQICFKDPRAAVCLLNRQWDYTILKMYCIPILNAPHTPLHLQHFHTHPSWTIHKPTIEHIHKPFAHNLSCPYSNTLYSIHPHMQKHFIHQQQTHPYKLLHTPVLFLITVTRIKNASTFPSQFLTVHT